MPLLTPSLNSGPFPPPALPGFAGTTNPSATPDSPACPSRASGCGLLPRTAWGFPCCSGHAAANTPVGPLGRVARGTAYSNRFPLTQRRRPSPELWRVGSHIIAFGACSAFTTRCGLSDRGAALRPFPSKAPAASSPPPPLRLLPAGAIQLPGGDYTHGRPAPYSRRT